MIKKNLKCRGGCPHPPSSTNEQIQKGGSETRPYRTPFRRGFTFIEFLITVIIITMIATFAVPNLLETRKKANESAAIHSLKNIFTAQEMYYQRNGIFAKDYGFLFHEGNLIKENLYKANSTLSLSSSPKNGYYFASYQRVSDQNFIVFAVPAIYDSYGNLSFCVDSSGNVYQKEIKGAPEETIKKNQMDKFFDPETSDWRRINSNFN